MRAIVALERVEKNDVIRMHSGPVSMIGRADGRRGVVVHGDGGYIVCMDFTPEEAARFERHETVVVPFLDGTQYAFHLLPDVKPGVAA